MRNILFFDLPTLTAKQRKEYRKFVKNLINNGYIMLQESVYSKLIMNYTAKDGEIERIKKYKPNEGLVQCLIVTEKQFAGIVNICGELITNKENSTERFIEIWLKHQSLELIVV